MKNSHQKSILFVQFPWRMSQVRLAGVYRSASEMGWRVQVAEYGRSTESIPKMLAFWNPDGCIVDGPSAQGLPRTRVLGARVREGLEPRVAVGCGKYKANYLGGKQT